jgi:hypothetical protein
MKISRLFLAGILLLSLSAVARENNNGLDNPPKSLTGPKAVFPQTYPSEAKIVGDKIVLIDDRFYTLTRTGTASPDAQLIMNSPVGAQVTIAYADGSDAFTATVPFVYKPATSKNNSYFKVTVNEGTLETTWFVILQNFPYFTLKIQ